MGVGEAAAWGMAGGAVAALVSISAAIVGAGFRWPWRRLPDGDGVWPYLTVGAINLAIGSVVAAATHSQIDGAWPALIMGASAPSVIRRILSHIEVTERKVGGGEPGGDGST
jgi:hypothetical protein